MSRLQEAWPKIASGAAIFAIAAVGAWISYLHIYNLTLILQQPIQVARVYAFSVDGLITAGSVVLLQGSRLGWLCIGPGVAASLYANFESGIAHGWRAAVWACIPAASFALATFVLEHWLKAQGKEHASPEHVAGIVLSALVDVTEAQAVLNEAQRAMLAAEKAVFAAQRAQTAAAPALAPVLPRTEAAPEQKPGLVVRVPEIVRIPAPEYVPVSGVTVPAAMFCAPPEAPVPELVPELISGKRVTRRVPQKRVPQKRVPAKVASVNGTQSPERVFARELKAGVLPGIREIKARCRAGTPRAQLIRQELKTLLAPMEALCMKYRRIFNRRAGWTTG